MSPHYCLQPCHPRKIRLRVACAGWVVPAAAFSLQSVTERFRRLPCLFIADMGIAHGRADILVAEQFLDFPQILSHLVEEDRSRGVAQPMRGDLPYPRALQATRSRKLNARLENGAPEYPVKTNCDPAKAIPPGDMIRRPLKLSWMAFHSRSDALNRPGTGTSWKTLPLPLIRRAMISSPTLWQSLQVSWINSSNRQAVWKRTLARWNARAEP